jgi:hypothetical protein
MYCLYCKSYETVKSELIPFKDEVYQISFKFKSLVFLT